MSPLLFLKVKNPCVRRGRPEDCELRGRGLNPAIEEINAPAVGGDTALGSRLYARAAWEEAIRLASTGAVSVGPQVSRRIPLEELQQGMEEVLSGGSRPVKRALARCRVLYSSTAYAFPLFLTPHLIRDFERPPAKGDLLRPIVVPRRARIIKGGRNMSDHVTPVSPSVVVDRPQRVQRCQSPVHQASK